jgi:hypothetical protein
MHLAMTADIVFSSRSSERSKRFFGRFSVRRVGFFKGCKTIEIGLLASHSDFSGVLTISCHPDAFHSKEGLVAERG